MRSLFLALCAFLSWGCLSANPKESGSPPAQFTIPSLVLPGEARAGQALFGWIPRKEADQAFLGEAFLLSPEGNDLRRTAVFSGPEEAVPGWDAFALPLPLDARAGTYQVVVRGTLAGNPVTLSRLLTVAAGEYASETIALTSELTAIRTEETPRKKEESRVYAEILWSVNPQGYWQDAPFVLPIDSKRRTSAFGQRRQYVYATGGTADSVHAGIDFAAPRGTPVTATGRGRVVLAADRVVTGMTVILEHLPGIYTIYMHLDSLAVAAETVVERGALLGTAGATGLATGPHLHWELRVNGEACDPESPSLWELFPAGLFVPVRPEAARTP